MSRLSFTVMFRPRKIPAGPPRIPYKREHIPQDDEFRLETFPRS